jgi:hypothetical protein
MCVSVLTSKEETHVKTTVGKSLLTIGGAGLIGFGALHLAWGAGLNWPYRSRTELASKVIGATDFPSPLACGVVAAPLLTAGVYSVAGAMPDSQYDDATATEDLPIDRSHLGLDTLAPLLVGTALFARGVMGGKLACKLVGLPEPNAQFLDLDRRVYQPLCLGIGGSVLLGKILTRR